MLAHTYEPRRRIRRRRATTWVRPTIAACAVGMMAAMMPPSPANAQQVGYTLTPTFTRAGWHDQFGLEPTTMLGGRLSFDFGPFVSLQSFYKMRNNVSTRLGQTPLRDELGNPLAEQEVDLQHYGADLVVLFGGGAVSPMLRGGGSVLRLKPETRDPIRLVGLNYGAGVRLGQAHRMSFDLMATLFNFRMNRLLLAPDTGVLEPGATDPEAGTLRRTLAFSAGVNVPFGGPATFDEPPPTLRWRQSAFPIELFGGQLNFGDAIGLENQQLLGARVGVDLARTVGIRGFYWRGMEDGFARTTPVQSWGAEAQLQLNPGPGLSPYLIGGAGQLDFRDGFVDPAGNPRTDATMLIIGGGLALPLTQQLRLNVAARDHIFSAGDLADPATADQLRHNWMFSAGVGFVIGGGADAYRERMQRERLERERAERERLERLRAEIRRDVREELDDVRPAERVADRRPEELDDVRPAQRVADRREEPTRPDDRTVAVPVPREGELYVRYGPDEGRAPVAVRLGAQAARHTDGSPAMAEIREAMREIVRQELDRDLLVQALARREGAPLPAERPRELSTDAAEQRIAERVVHMLRGERRAELDSLRREIRRDIGTEIGVRADQDRLLTERTNQAIAQAVRQEIDRHLREGTFAVAPDRQQIAAATDTVAGVAIAPARRTGPSLAPRQWWAYTGFGFTGSQMLLGARADLGAPWLRHPDLHLVPELSLGFFGSARTTMLAGHLQYTFPQFQLAGVRNLQPFVNGGLGLLVVRGGDISGREGTEAVLNLGYGIAWPIGATGIGSGPSEVFVEHQGVDLFSLNRLLVGLRAAF